jgi:CRP/FNR family transcriptional regulator, cyclic AMP receptor protein
MLLGTFEHSSTSTYEPRRRESVDLRRVALLNALDEEALALIQTHANVRVLPKGMTIIRAGEPAQVVYALLSGRAKLFLSNEDGKEIVLGTLEAGESFGEVALLDEPAMTAEVATLEPVRLLSIPRQVLAEIAQHDAQFALQLAQRLAQQVRQLSDQVRSLGLCNVYQRLAHVLSAMSEPAIDTAHLPNVARVIKHRFTHQELAKRIGASREMVTRIFRDLIVGGYLRVDGKRLIIAKKLPASW